MTPDPTPRLIDRDAAIAALRKHADPSAQVANEALTDNLRLTASAIWAAYESAIDILAALPVAPTPPEHRHSWEGPIWCCDVCGPCESEPCGLGDCENVAVILPRDWAQRWAANEPWTAEEVEAHPVYREAENVVIEACRVALDGNNPLPGVPTPDAKSGAPKDSADDRKAEVRIPSESVAPTPDAAPLTREWLTALIRKMYPVGDDAMHPDELTAAEADGAFNLRDAIFAALSPTPDDSPHRRVGVTGGRDFDDPEMLNSALSKWCREGDLLVHGNAVGADRDAALWFNERGWPTEPHNADWGRHGKAAGPIRNDEMLKSGLDILIAFPGGRGTADMVSRCQKAGVNVVFAATPDDREGSDNG